MNTTCSHSTDNKTVTGGVVRCMDCLEMLPEHPDSKPAPGLVEQNQTR